MSQEKIDRLMEIASFIFVVTCSIVMLGLLLLLIFAFLSAFGYCGG